ncbi:hypothetical protein CPB85DRAFT_809688 [Mucidula mucida]|nr:hypothetical protein CPB85DRAFT_809688 [Mucidula mucida]
MIPARLTPWTLPSFVRSTSLLCFAKLALALARNCVFDPVLSSIDIAGHARKIGNGAPANPLRTQHDTDSSGPPRKKVKRELQNAHSRRLAPCSSCFQGSLGWTKCDSSRCWSSGGYICPDCSPNGGIECEDEHMWICDSCTSKKHPVVWACPSCETLVCEKCPDVTRCVGCSQPKPCATCRGGEDDGRFEWDFEGCGARLCDTCRGPSGNGHAWTCNGCSKDFCNECSSDVVLNAKGRCAIRVAVIVHAVV